MGKSQYHSGRAKCRYEFLTKWEGAYTILLTAYTKDEGIDRDAMRSSVDLVREGGAQGVVALVS
jgi:dihydrodipicolinate synthase/N-acetylneuraminate lyase